MIENAYVINLKRRPDKLKAATCQLAEIGVTPIVVEAVDAIEMKLSSPLIDRAGAIGCLLSHRIALFDAVQSGFDRCVIFEDDIEIVDSFSSYFPTFLKQLPADWKMVWLGWDERAKTDQRNGFISSHVRKPIKPYGTQAIAYNGAETIQRAYELAEKLDHWDLVLERFSKEIPTYTPGITLFDQFRQESDIYADHRAPYKNHPRVKKWQRLTS